MSKSYRPEIDGLRSLAVLGVLFYHAEIVFQSFRIFPGGFLGVDLFFVISGYLITLLILKEYQSNNKFSFKNFYIRRAKRILPALILIIFVSSIFSYYYLLPIYFEEFIKSVTSSFFFFSNIFFHYSAQAYGAQALTKVPLLHTWSLSLEEQFYFLYPIFLIGILFFIKKGIKIILILGIIFSLIFATLINIDHQSFNFYMLPSRIWELLFGALL
jgi:peptidoglycan/LPS O-acetylase OafA/YrhL